MTYNLELCLLTYYISGQVIFVSKVEQQLINFNLGSGISQGTKIISALILYTYLCMRIVSIVIIINNCSDNGNYKVS